MQLPAGAAIVTSGPKLLYPTFVPTLRSPATATTPLTVALQFAGDSTGAVVPGAPPLPAATTTSTPIFVIAGRPMVGLP